jgi:HK97 gp10 family phage protein
VLSTRVIINFDHIPRMMARMPAETAIAVQATAHAVAQKAKAIVPVDTGALRDSIHVEGGGLDVAVIADTYYAAYVEFGTVLTPAQPYMTPAAESERGPFLARVRAAVMP